MKMKRGNARFIRQPLQRQVLIDLSIDQGNRPVDAFGVELLGHSPFLAPRAAQVDPKQPTFLAPAKNPSGGNFGQPPHGLQFA